MLSHICKLLDLKQLKCCTAVQVKYFHVSNIQGPPLAKCLKISCYMQLLTTLSNYCTEANSGPNLDNVSSLISSHNICINKNIIMSSLKSSRDIQKKEGGPDSLKFRSRKFVVVRSGMVKNLISE